MTSLSTMTLTASQAHFNRSEACAAPRATTRRGQKDGVCGRVARDRLPQKGVRHPIGTVSPPGEECAPFLSVLCKPSASLERARLCCVIQRQLGLDFLVSMPVQPFGSPFWQGCAEAREPQSESLPICLTAVLQHEKLRF